MERNTRLTSDFQIFSDVREESDAFFTASLQLEGALRRRAELRRADEEEQGRVERVSF